MFVGLELPALFGPLPDYAQHDTFELVMFYAVPAVIATFGAGLALVALRSGVFVDDRGLVVKPYAGVRSQRIPLDTIRAVTVTRRQGAVSAWVSPAVVPVSGDTVVLALAHYDTPWGRRRALGQAELVSRALERPFEESKDDFGSVDA
jgi:hypothetical protein